MDTQESELSFSSAGGLCLGRAHCGLEIFGDAWRDMEQDLRMPHGENVTDLASHRPDAIRVRLARSREVHSDAGKLVQRRYEARGYQVRRTMADPSLCTFAAYDRGRLLGTLGVRLDSSSGLNAEQLYGDEVADLRERGLCLMELTRLAVAESAASKEVLGALFHTALLFGHVVRQCTHAVIEVNPRHVAFYRRALFFKPLGPERHLDRLGAPAVALALDMSRLRGAVDEFFATTNGQQQANTFFSHWFSPAEVEGVLARLKWLDGERRTFEARADAFQQEAWPGGRAFPGQCSNAGLGLAA